MAVTMSKFQDLLVAVLLWSCAVANSLSLSQEPMFRGNHKNNTYSYETHFFTQTLDHFSFTPTSYATFQQRYLINTEHWGGPSRRSPIFFYCGNDGDITWFAENTGLLWEMAPTFKAMVVFAEHRYYGDSIPEFALDRNKQQTADTLGYLTSEQALADYAGLVLYLKEKYSAENSPVVAFGGSYGGMLAAWFRLKYPYIVVGALAASAPILFDGLAFHGFHKIVFENYKNASEKCFNTLKSDQNVFNATIIMKSFNFCSNSSLPDPEAVLLFIQSAFNHMALTNYPYPTDLYRPLPANPVNVACQAMDSLQDDVDVMSRVAAGVNVYYNTTGDLDCYDLEQLPSSNPNGMDWWDWKVFLAPRSVSFWFWQLCTEFTHDNNPSNDRWCRSVYGVPSPRHHWMEEEFGGHNMGTVLKRFGSNIIFSNGMHDPWSYAGVLENISESIVALVTARGAHNLDLRASTDEDPKWLIQQRNEERKHISHWLRLYYADLRHSSHVNQNHTS